MMYGSLTMCLLIAVSLALPGVINRVRAVAAGRKGVRIAQHMRNVRAMMRKGVVTGHASSWISTAAPCMYLASLLTAMMMIPFGQLPPLISFPGDVVLVAYLIALSRVTLILAALDTGSSFEGMGASREALYGAMIEPALFIVAGTLALLSGHTSFASMFPPSTGPVTPEAVIIMALLSYVVYRIITVEAGRIPVDDPRTHLELTMIHEVMILDYTGLDLAMITVGGWVKMGLLTVLAADAVGSLVSGLWGSVATVAAASVGVAAVIGVVESFTARNKMVRNTTYITTIVAVALVVFVVAYIVSLNIVAE